MTIKTLNPRRSIERLLRITFIACTASGPLVVQEVHAFKTEQTTLCEQVERADIVCVATITKADTPYRAKVIEIIKNREHATAIQDIEFTTLSLRPEDVPQFQKNEKRLLLLRINGEGKLEAAAYGKQAIWPKAGAEWPYTEAHAVSLELTVNVVRALLTANKEGDIAVARMISAGTPFERIAGLEYLMTRKNKTQYPLALREAEKAKDDVNPVAARLAHAASASKDGK